jgi:tellurite resistance protein
MTIDAYAPMVDPKTAALGRLIAALAEDAIFGLGTGGGAGILEGLGRRRGEAYQAILTGHRLNTMCTELDHWLVEMTRAAAPICPPAWMPMADVLREKVTLEVGARGLRSLFSSKPSDKDVLRVKRLGTLATRVLRAVYAADGPLDPEEQRDVAALVASLGLPDEEAQPLFAEAPIAAEQLDVYGDVDPAYAKALLRGAWAAAAGDAIDPREEHVIRTVANKLSFAPMELEALRNEAVQKVESRRMIGQAVVEAIRFVLADRIPGQGATLAASSGYMLVPRRYRDEALAPIGHGTKVTLARRYASLPGDDKETVLGVAWAAALYEDPSVARRALLRARHDRFAQDLGDDGAKARLAVDEWVNDVLAPAAFPMSAD